MYMYVEGHSFLCVGLIGGFWLLLLNEGQYLHINA